MPTPSGSNAHHGDREDRPRMLRAIAGAILIVLSGSVIWFGIHVSRNGLHYTLGHGQRPLRHSYTHEKYEQTRQSADALVAAIEQHKAQRGSYPQSLDNLTLEFLPRIDPPVVGDGVWQYTASPDRFTLTFFVGPIYEGDSYDSSKGSWYVDR